MTNSDLLRVAVVVVVPAAIVVPEKYAIVKSILVSQSQTPETIENRRNPN